MAGNKRKQPDTGNSTSKRRRPNSSVPVLATKLKDLQIGTTSSSQKEPRLVIVNVPEPAKTMGKALEKYGILEMQNLQPQNLTNPIHPIFCKDNWEGTDKKLYRAMEPALQLASRFLTCDPMLNWWVTAAVGDTESNPETGGRYLTPTRVNEARLKHTKAILNELGSRFIRFGWSELTRDCGLTRFHPKRTDDGPRDAILEPSKPKTVIIRVRKEVKRTLLGQLGKKTRGKVHPLSARPLPESTKQRNDFFFAVTLVHELAHALEFMRFGFPNHISYAEKDVDYEFGFSWEMAVFGRCMHPCDAGPHPMVVPHWGLACEVWRPAGKMPEGGELWAVRMEWVNQWFQDEFWASVEKQGMRAAGLPASKLGARWTNEVWETIEC